MDCKPKPHIEVFDDETLLFRVDPSQIIMMNFLFKGYGHLAVVRTLDPEKGEVELLVSPDTKQEVVKIVEAFLREESERVA